MGGRTFTMVHLWRHLAAANASKSASNSLKKGLPNCADDAVSTFSLTLLTVFATDGAFKNAISELPDIFEQKTTKVIQKGHKT